MNQRDGDDGTGCFIFVLLACMTIGSCSNACRNNKQDRELKSLRLAVEQYGIVVEKPNE